MWTGAQSPGMERRLEAIATTTVHVWTEEFPLQGLLLKTVSGN